MNVEIPRFLQDKVDRELDANEHVVWVDVPVPRFFTIKSTSAFLFAIPWTAFAVFWICGASGFQIPKFDQGFDLFPLFGLPFVLIGCGMLATPLWVYRKALKTVYVITDKRAITIDGGLSTTVRSYPPEELRKIYRKERRGDVGDVVFKRRAMHGSEEGCYMEELGFMSVRKPKEVEVMICELVASNR